MQLFSITSIFQIFESWDDTLTNYEFFLPWRQTSTWSKYSDQRFIIAIKTMEGLFIYLTAVNISEISEKTASVTLREFCFFVRIYKLR